MLLQAKYSTWLLQALITLCAVIVFAWPLSSLGTFHLRIVEAINTDEGEFLWPMILCMQRGDFDIGRNDYGLLYYNITLIICKALSIFKSISDSDIIQVARLISFAFLVGTSWVMGLIARQIRKNAELLTFVVCLFGSATLLKYGRMLHPDTAQVFFITYSIYWVVIGVRKNHILPFFLSALCAGLAFSAKFGGVILLPAIFLAFVYVIKQRRNDEIRYFHPWMLVVISALTFWLFDASWIDTYLTEEGSSRSKVLLAISIIRWSALVPLGIGVIALVPNQFSQNSGFRNVHKSLFGILLLSWSFLLSFGLTSPQVIPNFSFLDGFIYVTSLHSEGHWFYDNSGFLGWCKLLFSKEVMPGWVLVLILLGLYAGWKKSENKFPYILSLFWIVLFLVVLSNGVSSKFAHYLIPIVPFFLLLAGLGATFLFDFLCSNLPNRAKYYLQIGVVVLAGLAFSLKLHVHTQQMVVAYQNSDELAVGEWLSKNVREEVFILCDKYVYVPPEPHFKHFAPWGLLPEHLDEMNPQYIIIHKRIYEHFLDSNRAEEYLGGAELYLKRNRLYLKLAEDKHPDYVMVKEMDRIQVLSRKGK